jgi:quinol-cytochrome oxidoreductase complex cytochrome b subunit
MESKPRRWEKFLDERLPYFPIRNFLRQQLYKRLPPHTGWMHVLGSLALLTFISQFVTGILLLLYYRPTLDEAHESIQYITGEVAFGWLFRQVHAWGATVMMIAVILHMTRTYFMGSFKKPREFTWVIGVLLFVVTMLFGFTGYLLPWNQLSYWATTVGTEVVGAVPYFGGELKTVLLGGPSVGQETLSRFFVIHVVILPWILVILIGLHLVLMRIHNLATLDDVGKERSYPPEAGVPFWPVHMAKEACVAAVCFAVLLTLSVLRPWEIGEPADPLETPEGIKPEWYFLPTYQLLKYFTGPVGKVLGIAVSGVPFLLLLFWPAIERNPGRHPRRRKWAVGVGIVAVLLALFLGTLGHLAETTRQIGGRTYEFDMYGVPHLVEGHEAAEAAGGGEPAQARP